MKYSIALLGSMALFWPMIGHTITDNTSITTALFGESEGSLEYMHVRTAGDVNADGFDDFLISNKFWEVYLIYGAANLASTLSFDNAVQIDTSGSISRAVVGACDLNGDGYDDFVIGGDGTNDTPAVFVQYGRAKTLTDRTSDDLISIRVEATSIDSNGINYISQFACAGDMDGDGYDDLALGSPNYGDPSTGAAYIVFGQAERFSDDAIVDAVRFTGAETYDFLGSAVVGAGDMNGDGLADLLISASGKDDHGAGAGAVYIVYGRLNRYTNRSLKHFPRLYGKYSGDSLGAQMGAVGDMNNDGYDDVIVKAPNYKNKNGSEVGAVYLLYGRARHYTTGSVGRFEYFRGQNTSADIAKIDGMNKTPGDVNGDGFSDLLAIGSRSGTNRDYKGLAYLIRGKANQYSTQRLTVKKYKYIKFTDQYFNVSGDAISFIGDVDGNGRSDVALIDDNDDTAGFSFGKIYFIFN